jgi:hypothetical protein
VNYSETERRYLGTVLQYFHALPIVSLVLQDFKANKIRSSSYFILVTANSEVESFTLIVLVHRYTQTKDQRPETNEISHSNWSIVFINLYESDSSPLLYHVVRSLALNGGISRGLSFVRDGSLHMSLYSP